jgi:hypothetical protein
MGSSSGLDDGASVEGGDEQGTGDGAAVGADASPDVVTCVAPMVYGGSSGSGMESVGWMETCSNGHTYKAYCQYPYCECDCYDWGPDGGTESYVRMCGGTGFAACGYPCFSDAGGSCTASGPTDASGPGD